MVKRALRVTAFAIPLVFAGNHSSTAGVFHFGPTVSCYYYDPYDRYHLYGKYYPYSRAHCRHRSLSCYQAKRLVRDSGFRRVRTVKCNGWIYTFEAIRKGRPRCDQC